MFGNLISFLVLLAVLVLFGWLTFRSWRIKRWLFKIPALLVTGLLTLVLGLISFFAGKGLALMTIALALGFASNSTFVLLAASLGLIPAHAFFLKYFEEVELELRFGESYLEYKKTVPFLIPKFK
jgi:hypothetical protein